MDEAQARIPWHRRALDLARRAVVIELRIYTSIVRAIARRPAVPAGAAGFRYHRPVRTILIIFIVLSALEIPIIDAVVHRWPPVRVGFLILGIWGLTWMIGLWCAYATRPHVVGDDALRIREGLETEIPVRWRDCASVHPLLVRQESIDPTSTDKPGRIFAHDGVRVCAIWVGSETNVEVRFDRPTEVRLPGLPPRGGAHRVDVVRFWADDPAALITRAGEQLAR